MLRLKLKKFLEVEETERLKEEKERCLTAKQEVSKVEEKRSLRKASVKQSK